MSDQLVQVKLQWEDSLRRASVSRKESLVGFKRAVCSLIGVESCEVTYTDEEGDVITVGSDLELSQLLETAFREKHSLRFVIKSSSPARAQDNQDDNGREDEEELPKEPEFPFSNLAKALCEPSNVQRIQATFQSPVFTEAVTKFARVYVETQGDHAMASLISAQHIPALMGVIAELVSEFPVLKDLQEYVVRQFMQGGSCGAFGVPFARPVPPQAAGCAAGGPFSGQHCHPGKPFGGPCQEPPGHQGHHGHQGHPGKPDFTALPAHCASQAHWGVLCDGCSSDDALKTVSFQGGHINRRGFIRGMRFKSHSVHDFDLCRSCKNNVERFPDSAYGPFTAIPPPDDNRGQKRCWGWQRRHGAPQQSWRAQPQHQEANPPAATAVPNPWEFVDAMKDVIKKGSQAFVEATQGQNNELSDIARAIAESLKEVSNSSTSATPVQTYSPVPEVKQEVPNTVTKEVTKEDIKPDHPEQVDPFAKWSQQLAQLQTLGFDRLETYVDFLEEEKGDLERVVNRIVRRDM